MAPPCLTSAVTYISETTGIKDKKVTRIGDTGDKNEAKLVAVVGFGFVMVSPY